MLAAELMEGPVGYDMSHAVWHNAGWQEMKDLRKKLEDLKELRELIKKLGRASGKGPKRRAPQEVRHQQSISLLRSASFPRLPGVTSFHSNGMVALQQEASPQPLGACQSHKPVMHAD